MVDLDKFAKFIGVKFIIDIDIEGFYYVRVILLRSGRQQSVKCVDCYKVGVMSVGITL